MLNQADVLTAAQVDDCVSDLRRLLDSENLQDVPILVSSAVTGSGIEELRRLLAEGVAARRGAAARISADVDTVVARFARYAGDAGEGVRVDPGAGREQAGRRVLRGGRGDCYRRLAEQRQGVARRRLRRLASVLATQRLTGRNPLRKVRLGALWNDLRSISAGPAGAQQAAIDNALTQFGDQLAEPLPKPWSGSVKAATRSRGDAIPGAIGEAIGEALPAEDSVDSWWRAAGLWQGFLLGAAAIALAWAIAVLVIGVFGAASGALSLLTDPIWILWALLIAAAALAAGAFTASACLSAVRKRVAAENTELAADIRKRIDAIAREMAVAPAEQELQEFDRYREEFAIASKDVPAHAQDASA